MKPTWAVGAVRLPEYLSNGCIRNPRLTGSRLDAVRERSRPPFAISASPHRSSPATRQGRSSSTLGRISRTPVHRSSLPEPRPFQAETADSTQSFSGLVLNFLPDPGQAVASIRERLRPGGIVAAYVWDYAEGMEFLRCFWEEAVASDPRAGAFNESRRFPLCQRSALESLFRAAGLAQVETDLLDIPTDFASFDDYWTPFLRGTGPAPSYVVSLDPPSRELLRERLRRRLHPGSEGRIHLRARAWAVRGLSN